MDRLDAMSTLLAVVDGGSLSAGARRLRMPLATVSRRVSDLEAQLKARLFNRSSRRVTLTDAGAAYVAACRRILDDVEEAERAASGEYSAPKGEVIVTAPQVFGRLQVVPVAAEFLRAYPDIDLRLMLSDRVVDLVEDHVDVALRIGHLPDSTLMAIRVGAVRSVVCASPAYLAARGTPASPADFAGHDCVAHRAFGRPDVWELPDGGAVQAVTLRPRLVVDSAEAAVDAAAAGIGMARLFCYQVADAVRAGRLTLLCGFERPPLPVSLVYPGGGRLPLKLRAFLDFAAPRLKARLAEILSIQALAIPDNRTPQPALEAGE